MEDRLEQKELLIKILSDDYCSIQLPVELKAPVPALCVWMVIESMVPLIKNSFNSKSVS